MASRFIPFIIGVAVGAVAVQQLTRTDAGEELIEKIEQRAQDISGAVVAGYQDRQAELRSALAEAKSRLDDLID